MTTQRALAAVTILNLAILMFVLAQLGPAVAQDVASVVRARALEIVDARGTVRARINVEPSGADGKAYPEAVVFRMTDAAGLIRVKLGADRDGSGLVLADDSQQPGIHVLARGAGSFLKVANKDGREQLVKP